MEEKNIAKHEVDIEKEILLITTLTAERLFALGVDAWALYGFYYLTAKRQARKIGYENLTVKATTLYCVNGTGMSKTRVQNAKKILVDEGFIEEVIRREGQRISGFYVRIKYAGGNLYWPDSLLAGNPTSREINQLRNQLVENQTTNTLNKNISTYESNDKITIHAPANAGTPSKDNNLEQMDTHNIKISQSAVSTLDPTLLKQGTLEPSNAGKGGVQKSLTKVSGGSKPPKTISKECTHGSTPDVCSKCGRHPCTEEELWEIAEKTNVGLSFVEDKHQQILDMIESGEFSKKYTTVFFTLRNWVRMAKEKGYAPVMEGFEKEIFIKNSPEVVRKKKFLLEAAVKAGIL